MELRKIVPAVVVGYVVLAALSFLIHGVWLLPTYRQMTAFRAEELLMHKRWVMWIGQLVFVVMFTWIYTRGVENKPWVAQGVRYGIVMTLLAVVPAVCTEYVVYPITYPLALKWMVAGGVEMIVLGLIVAGFCRKPAS